MKGDSFIYWQRSEFDVSIADRVTLLFLIIASIALGSIFAYFGFWFVAIVPVVAWIIPNFWATRNEHKTYRALLREIETIGCAYPDCPNPIARSFRTPGSDKIYHRCLDHLEYMDDVAADLAPKTQPYRGSPWVQVQS